MAVDWTDCRGMREVIWLGVGDGSANASAPMAIKMQKTNKLPRITAAFLSFRQHSVENRPSKQQTDVGGDCSLISPLPLQGRGEGER